MNPKLKSTLIWLFAFFFTAGVAIYQRMTGPTYPVRGHVMIDQQNINYELIRTYDGEDDAKVIITLPDKAVKGQIKYRRFKSYDDWTTVPMQRQGNDLVGALPHQPIAGKVMYEVTLSKGTDNYRLSEGKDVVMRYKGHVPLWVLLIHIIIIFSAMLFSTRTGLEVIFKGKHTYAYTWVTVITLFIGGLILGPVVQKSSFGVFWAGWPFGHDLTDNKSLVAFIFWVIALVIMYRNRAKRIWAVVAAVIMLIVFLIPHSMLGSEIDYTKQPKTEINK